MTRTITIVNDITKTIEYVTERNPRMVEEYAGRVMGMIQEMTDAGFEPDNIGAIFTTDGTQFRIGDPTPPDDYIVHFALLKLDDNGSAVGLFKAILVDLKRGAIGDIQITAIH